MSTLSIFSHWEKKDVHRYSKSQRNRIISNIEIIDTNTLLRYRNEDKLDIAIKCYLIFLMNPVVLIGKLLFHCIQLGYDFIELQIKSYLEISKDFQSKKFFKIFKKCIFNEVDFLKYLLEDIAHIIRAPIFSLGIQLASFFGIFFPLEGRKLLANIERESNLNIDVKYDWIRLENETQETSSFFYEIFSRKRKNIAFYMAPCFQPIGSLKDRNIIRFLDV